MFVAEQV